MRVYGVGVREAEGGGKGLVVCFGHLSCAQGPGIYTKKR